MSTRILMTVLLAAFCYGCAMEKIGGVKSVEETELSRDLKTTRIESFRSITPQLSVDGKLSLWVSGQFDKTYNVHSRVTEYGDEWKAIGLFPGYDSHVNGYWAKDGEKELPGAFIVGTLVCNGVLCGMYTVCSLLEFFDPNVAKFNNGILAASIGIVGTYKYEGARYELRTFSKYEESQMRDDALEQAKGFCVEIGGQILQDNDGEVLLRSTFIPGDTIRFKVTQVPSEPKGCEESFQALSDYEFSAICK